MENQSFELYRSFNSEEEAEYLIDLLKENEIPFEVIAPKPAASLIVRSETDNLCLINIHPEDFQKANLLLKKVENTLSNTEDGEYYLFQFSDEELKDILVHEDEWSSHDFALARRILTDRNVKIDEDELRRKVAMRMKSEYAPRKGNMVWMVVGLITALLGGFFGIILGSVYYQSYKTDPNGKKHYQYDQQTRAFGLAMLTIGIIVLAVLTLWTLITGINR